MRLTDLDPTFYRIVEPGRHYTVVDTLAEAQGIDFLCPDCFTKNSGPRGTHHVICWFQGRGVLDDETPKPGRWDVTGTDFTDLTLSPSVHLTGPGCGWHGFVKAGEVI